MDDQVIMFDNNFDLNNPNKNNVDDANDGGDIIDNNIDNNIDNTIDNNIKINNKNHSTRLQIYKNKILGKGSFSKVFLGKYKDKLVAVKIIFTKYLDSKIALRLKRELDVIKILQKKPHINIVTYYKIIENADRMIIIMELCPGGELTKHIKMCM